MIVLDNCQISGILHERLSHRIKFLSEQLLLVLLLFYGYNFLITFFEVHKESSVFFLLFKVSL